MNKQREIIYSQRKQVLNGENLKDAVLKMADDIIEKSIMVYSGEGRYYEEWDIEGLVSYVESIFVPKGHFTISDEEKENITRDYIIDKLKEIAKNVYIQREEFISSEQMRELERVIMLRIVDEKWMEHLDEMDQLRQGIGLRAYGQRDPVIEYKYEGFSMFESMIELIREDVVKILFSSHIEKVPERQMVAEPIFTNLDEEPHKPKVREDRVGRNDLCPCGSGKKYKKCCGR